MDSWVKKARQYIQYCLTLSCGHCLPCRLGLPSVLQILKSMDEEQPGRLSYERLNNLIHTLDSTSLCPVGQTCLLPIKIFLEKSKENLNVIKEAEQQLELARCRSCGRPFAFKAFLDYLHSKVDKALGVELEREYCPQCIRKVRSLKMAVELSQLEE